MDSHRCVKAVNELAFGSRIYIAFTGEIEVPKVMESRATYMRGNYGGINGRALK